MRIATGFMMLACLALPGVGQHGVATAQQIDLQWAGCWDLQDSRDDAEEFAITNRRLCIESDASTLTVVTLVDSSEIRRD